MMLKHWLTYLLLFFSFVNHAQQFNFKTYSLKEGLSRSGVYHILQDKNGFLWVGTEGGGVCKFDGHHFKKYSHLNGLPSDNVRVVFEDSKGVIWLATDKGLSYYFNRKFYTLTVKDGLKSNFVRTLSEDSNGNLWVGTDFGISIIDINTKQISKQLKVSFVLPNRKVRTILADSNIVWIGTDAGLCKYEHSKLKVYTTKSGLAGNLILSLFLSKDGALWVGTSTGLSILTNNSIKKWTTSDGLINNRVRTIIEDDEGNIWIGTKKGISIFDGRLFLNLNTKNGLSNDRIRCIQKDNFNNIWIGSYFGGIMRFNYKDFIAFTTKDGLISNQISCITGDDNNDVIVGSFDGVSKLKMMNNKVVKSTIITSKNGLINNHITSVLKDENGYYWYGSDKGLTIIKDSLHPIKTITEGLSSTYITTIKYFNNRFWVGTKKGLSIIEPDQFYHQFKITNYFKKDGLNGHQVSTILMDFKNRVWVGFSDGQLSVFENDSIFSPQLDSNINEINTVVFDDKNRIWLGTNGKGIYYANLTDSLNYTLKFKNINQSNQLSSDYIFSLLYHNQSIWVGNEKGVNLIQFKLDSTLLVQNFGTERGFLGLQNNLNASYVDKDSNLWFGTINGLYFLSNQHANHHKEGAKSITYITNIVVNNKHIDWETSRYCKGTKGIYQLPKDLKLPYDYNKISFEFIAINYVAPEKIKYSWRLNGFENEWSPLSSNTFVNYSNLDPGKYVFELRSTNELGILNDEIVRFEFKIKTPYWKSWWFIIGAIVISLIFILEFLGWRTRVLRKKQKELEKIVESRTKEVVEQKEKIENKQKKIEKQNLILQEKNKEITDSIQYSKRIQKSILPSKEKVQNLLKNYFIFYRPKDIVSGDFFWVEQNPSNPKQVFFAAADCTGHGVPGAMVSMISTTALNSSLLEDHLTSPGLILDKTKDIVVEAFTDHETGTIIKDGMDIALGSLDYSDEKDIVFEFAGAQNPAWVITDINEPNLLVNGTELQPDLTTETHQLFVIPATKQPIGYFEDTVSFKNNICSVKNGYHIYLFSDGFADQFGGEKGKKYKYKKFKLFLLSIQKHPIDRQKLDVEQEFYKWKGDFEQLDDVCVIGVKV